MLIFKDTLNKLSLMHVLNFNQIFLKIFVIDCTFKLFCNNNVNDQPFLFYLLLQERFEKYLFYFKIRDSENVHL